MKHPLDYAFEQVRKIQAMRQELREIEQILGRALGYPRFCDDQENFPDATEADGVCTGDHTPVTLAMEAAARIEELKEQLADQNHWDRISY